MAWSQSGNIRGASGVPGASGASGLQGASGVPGATGPTGASGPAGTTTWSGITDKPAVIAAGVDAAAARNVISAEYTGNKGQPSGYAALDASGLVPSSQLPSFVDDVVEAANLAAFPATGESGKIYTALDTNKVYRWGGSSYTEISPSPGSTDAVPEGSTNLYYTAARADGRITAAVGSTVQAYSATLTTYAGKTAPTGAVVGTTDTQTLTNKDLSGSSNTFPAFIRRSITTITAPTTLGASGGTDYVTFLSKVGDVNFSSVKLLLHGEGTNNSTTVVDSSSSNRTVTARGAAKISTAQAKFGSASLFFNGADSVTVANSSDFDQNITAWTVEMWFYRTTTSGGVVLLYALPITNGLQLGISGSKLIIDEGGIGTALTGATTITNNVWHHAAMVKNGSTVTLYLNGTSEGSITKSGVAATATTISVGGSHDASNYYFTGYIDEVRVSRIARYTGNFTVPSAAFGDVEGTVGTPTLPGASGALGRYSFRNISDQSITIGASGSQAINGATGGLAIASGSSTELMSDGSGWYTF